MGQGPAHSYLHPTNVNGQDSGEKQHLKEEVRHQPHDSKETELLKPEHTRGTMTLRPSTLEKPSPPAGTSASAGQWQAGHSGDKESLLLNLGVAKVGQCPWLPASPPEGSRDPSHLNPHRLKGGCSPPAGS